METKHFQTKPCYAIENGYIALSAHQQSIQQQSHIQGQYHFNTRKHTLYHLSQHEQEHYGWRTEVPVPSLKPTEQCCVVMTGKQLL